MLNWVLPIQRPVPRQFLIKTTCFVVFRTTQAASEIRENNVEIYVITLTLDADAETSAARISSEPHVEGSTYWLFTSFDVENSSYGEISNGICSGIDLEQASGTEHLDPSVTDSQLNLSTFVYTITYVSFTLSPNELLIVMEPSAFCYS